MSRTWTPGPWKVVSDGFGEWDIQRIGMEYDMAVGSFKPDAELIALAPEMAEAIMQADFACECYGNTDCPTPVIHDLAAKLRAIDKEQAPEGSTTNDVTHKEQTKGANQ